MQANYNWRTAENARLLTAPWNELSADDQEVAIKLAEELGERLMVNKSELWDSKSYHEKLQKVFAEAQMVPDDLPLPENDERVKFFLRGAENGKLQINRSDDVPYAVVDYYNHRVLWHGMAHDPISAISLAAKANNIDTMDYREELYSTLQARPREGGLWVFEEGSDFRIDDRDDLAALRKVRPAGVFLKAS